MAARGGAMTPAMADLDATTSSDSLRARREAVVREHMESENEHDFDTTTRSVNAIQITDIAIHPFDLRAHVRDAPSTVSSAIVEHTNALSVADQCPHEVGANEAGAAGDEIHALSLPYEARLSNNRDTSEIMRNPRAHGNRTLGRHGAPTTAYMDVYMECSTCCSEPQSRGSLHRLHVQEVPIRFA